MGKKPKHQATSDTQPRPAPKLSSPQHVQGNKQQHQGHKGKPIPGNKGEGQGGVSLKMPKADVGQPKSGGR